MVNRARAIEDVTLNIPSPIISSRNRAYSDIDATFENKNSINPNEKTDIYKKYDIASIKQALKNLLLTNHGEKVFQPYYGGNLTQHLFDLADDVEEDINNSVRMTIANYEPRVRVISVETEVNLSNNSVAIQVIFQIVNTEEQATLDLSVHRIR